MKARILSFIAAAMISLLPSLSHAGDGHANHGDHAEAAAKPQTKCPILGGAVNKEVFVDYKGKRVYFCCPGCDKKFLAKADELIAKAEADGIQFEASPAAAHGEHAEHAAPGADHADHAGHHAAEGTATEQTMCPVSNEPIDKAIFVMHDGQKVYLCCKMCRAKFKKDPDTYMKKLNGEPAVAPAPAAAGDGHGGDGHEHHNH